MIDKDLVIVGGGAGGLSAAISAYNNGIKDILILEREDHLGGILHQCIHNGFGLTKFKEELTGPEYAFRHIQEVEKLGIEYKLDTQVLNISKDKVVTYSNPYDGLVDVKAKAIVIATGSYERTPGAIMLPGDRVAGITTAGTAQKICNITGFITGKRVVILGSGDIGLIMARRLTLEGAKVVCVAEIMPYSNGLQRNIVQCLNDYNIPLYLSTTVSNVIGKKRVEKVVLSKVDEKLQIIPNTEMEIECDCLVLSVGLIPQTTLLENLKVNFGNNRGAKVDENLMTEIPGVFTCGNALHIHDLVDFVSEEGDIAGKGAAEYLKNNIKVSDKITFTNGDGVGYVVPNFVNRNSTTPVNVKFRVRKPHKTAVLRIKSGDNVILKRPLLGPVPSVMFNIPLTMDKIKDFDNIEVEVTDE